MPADASQKKKKKERIKRSPGVHDKINNALTNAMNKAGQTVDKQTKTERDVDGTPMDVIERRRMAEEIDMPGPAQKDRFNKFIGEVLATGIEGLLKEFDTEIKGYYTPNLRKTAYEQNKGKNRYKDVVCLDQTRVILQGGDNDYIHANYVRGEPLLNTFICTQGPLPSTSIDFWRMVVQERAGNIVMLCQVEELGKKKSDQYWPKELGQEKVYGPYTIRCIGLDSTDRRIINSTLTIHEKGKELFNLKHYQWTDWPDRSVPQSLLAVFRLLRYARNSRYPTVVHCSAGVGRTGAFVAIEMILTKMVTSEPFKIWAIVRQLRCMRAAAVQTAMQYVYLAMAVLNYCCEMQFMNPEYLLKFNIFKDAYLSLAQKRQTEEEARMKGVAPDIACVIPPPPQFGLATPTTSPGPSEPPPS